jgi:hypothetical protein
MGIFRSQERQEIIAVLKGAGKNENGKLHPMSVSQIMAAVERADRNAVDQLLYKMRKAGEIEVAGRGLYTLAGQDPINGGQIGASVSAPAQSDRQSDREQSDQDDLTGAESGQIAAAPPPGANGEGTQSPSYSDQVMVTFGARYPDCVEDGRRFLERWGERAEACGWSPDDVVDLITGPRRGCEVLELSGAQASIRRNPKTGKVNIVYRQALRWHP